MKHLENFLSRLSEVEKVGAGWKARCPCAEHEDRTPSLSINISDLDQRILVHCFGGCTNDAILEAMELDAIDLWPQPGDLEDVGSAAEVSSSRSTTESDPALCNNVYTAMISKLVLSDAHREKLRDRGLTDEKIDQNGYRSLSFFQFRNKAVAALRNEFGDQLLKVPGFTTKNDKVTVVEVPNGILIPVRDFQGRIVACQVRIDSGNPKYCWLSGGDTSSGSPAHIPVGTKFENGIRVTEGPLKADIAFALDGIPTMAVAGVATWQSALPVLAELPVKVVRLAFDADVQEKRGVAIALKTFAAALQGTYDVQVDTWPMEQGKGLDDLLHGGHKPTKLKGDDAKAYLDNLPGDDDDQAPIEEEVTASECELNPEPLTAEQDSTEAPSTPPRSTKGPGRFPYGDGDPVAFPIDFFPEQLQEVAQNISQAVNCPVDIPACAMVVVSATAIGRSRQIEPKDDWKISPRIYMGVVGDPGCGKTPAITKIMKPLWRQNHEWIDEYKDEKKEFEVSKLTYEAEKKEFIKHVSKKAEQAKKAAQSKGRQRDDDEDAAELDTEGTQNRG